MRQRRFAKVDGLPGSFLIPSQADLSHAEGPHCPPLMGAFASLESTAAAVDSGRPSSVRSGIRVFETHGAGSP